MTVEFGNYGGVPVSRKTNANGASKRMTVGLGNYGKFQ